MTPEIQRPTFTMPMGAGVANERRAGDRPMT
jgi:hypothetical protein